MPIGDGIVPAGSERGDEVLLLQVMPALVEFVCLGDRREAYCLSIVCVFV